MMKVSNLCVTLLAAQLLISCGGGGGGSDPSIQPTPTTPVAPPTPAISSNLDSQVQGTINGTINYEDIDRTFILYVPSSYDRSSKQPLVFNFHGYGSNASEQMAYGDMRSQADANGFILVHPEALDDIYGRSRWNIGGGHKACMMMSNLLKILLIY